MKYQRYSAYRDSGVEWLGVVPQAWHHSKIKFVSYVKGRVGWHGLNSQEFQDAGVHLVTGTDFVSGMVKWETCYRISEVRYAEDPYIHLVEDDLLITKDGTIGKLARVKNLPGKASLNSGIFVVRPLRSSYISDYLFWVLSSGIFRQYFGLMQTGSTINHLYQEVFEGFSFPIPSITEQEKISSFLDREVGKIGALIAKQERLIALLHEKRQALISHVVTKGLNPDVPMKESGVEWLGDVPKHWEVKRMKHIAHIQTGVAKGRDLSEADSIEVPYLRVANVQDGYVDLSDVATIAIPRVELERYTLQAGDVLMNEGGDNDKLGRGAVWHSEIDPCIHQNHVFAVRPYGVDSEWLNLITGADYAKFYFFSFAKQSTNLASISSSNLRELPVVCPPKEERQAILNYVKTETELIDALCEKAQAAVSCLQERRTTLISAAVIGKIDVRNLAN